MNHPVDFNEDDSVYLKLIRIDLAVWALLRRDRRLKSLPPGEERALYEAISIIVGLKQHRKAFLREKKLIENAKVRERFRLKTEGRNAR